MIPNSLHTSQFVGYLETIQLLYRHDDDFRTLCDDYLISKSSFGKFRKKSIEDKKMELVYELLTRDLEKEILEYVIKRS